MLECQQLLKAHKQELSPYNSINGYINRIEKYAHESTKMLISSVAGALDLRIKKSHDAPLIFKGKIQYNPRTGKPITEKEWKQLESSIIKFLGFEKDQLKKKTVQDSFWLGHLINRLDDEQRRSTPISSIDIGAPKFEEIGYTAYDQDLIDVSDRMSGIFIQNVDDRAKSKLQQIISNGTRQRKSKGEIFSDLWAQEEVINKDWDRVIRTETAANANTGFLLTTLKSSEPGETVFMKGISAPSACKYCMQLVNERIVVLVSRPMENDVIEVDGVEYETIWPGKNNYGRKPADYWAANIIHPYCRCVWTEWDPELEKYFKE